MTRLTQRLLRTTVLAGVATTGFSVAPALAQDNDESVVDDQIVVTGSRIARPEIEANSPVTIVGEQDFTFTGTVNTEQLLNELPQVVPGLTGQTNNPGNGTATINLRNLGATRTLVLVDGVRAAPTEIEGIVDLNTIPAALIERTEILTGGAASVYGSDAVAGVVNFILRDDFEGAELSTQWETTEEDDGRIFNVNGTIGASFDDGRGNVVLSAGFTNREQVLQGARDFSENTFIDLLASEGGPTRLPTFGSSATENTTLQGSLGSAQFDRDGNIIDNQGSYNYAPPNFLQLPQQRYNLFASGRYDITDNVEFYSQFNFTQNRSESRLAPTPLARGVFGTDPLVVDIDTNPFVTDSFRDYIVANLDDDGDGVLDFDADGDGVRDAGTDGTVNVRLRRRLTEVGPREQLYNRDSFQVRAGFRGDFGNGLLEEWTWDTLFQFGRVNTTFTQEGNVSQARIQQAANAVEDDDGNIVCADPTGGCAPINLFGEGTISDEAAAFVDVVTAATTNRDQRLLIGTVQGPIGITSPVANSPIAVALGVEYREDEAEFRPSELLAIGDISGFNGQAPVGGSTDVYEYFGEILIPLVEGAPFADTIELEGSFRRSEYSNIDDTVDSYAASARWAPVPDLLFRASYARAVRAPNINELFGPQNEGFPPAQDPCRTSGGNDPSAIRDICVNTGVPAALIDADNFNADDSQVRGLFGGNPDLNEETADTFTVGAIFQPSFVEGLTVTVDYFDIEVEDAISTFGADVVLDRCYAADNTQGADSQFCQLVDRGTSGLIDQIVLTNQNTASLATSGVDVGASYNLDPADFVSGWDKGTFRLDYNGSFNTKDDFTPLPGAETVECVGNFGATCGSPLPEYGHTLTTRWLVGDVTTQLRWQYIGEYDDERIEFSDVAPSDIFVPTFDAVNYLDLSGQYALNDMFRFTLGVRNLTDEEPPLGGARVTQQANTYPARYDVLGRTYFVSLRAGF